MISDKSTELQKEINNKNKVCKHKLVLFNNYGLWGLKYVKALTTVEQKAGEWSVRSMFISKVTPKIKRIYNWKYNRGENEIIKGSWLFQ